MLGVCAIIFDESGRVLLTRRRDNGQWCLPGGAYETGESVSEAISREVREETGLAVEADHLIGVYSTPHRFSQYNDGNRYQLVILSFLCKITGGTTVSSTDETTDIGYFDPNDLPELVEPHYERIKDALAANTAAIIK
jgi:ADP-ribose pyrophosphatase YjhB (NUDIX family)